MVWVPKETGESRGLDEHGVREAPPFNRRATGVMWLGHFPGRSYPPLPRSVPPHPASVLRLWSREAGGCGRAGCGHRPDRAEARTHLVPPRERSAGTVAISRIIQPRAQAEEGSGFFLNGSSGIGARHGETRQQQNRSLPVATQPSQPMPYYYSLGTCPIVRRRGSYDL